MPLLFVPTVAIKVALDVSYEVSDINARLLALEIIYSVCSDALAKAINMLRLTSSFS